jgi:hypothetical protein
LNPIFQYIAATLIVVLTLSFTLFAVVTSASVQLGTNSQEQIQPVANSLMDAFVLTGGSPNDWGSNLSILSNNLSDFGLAVTSHPGTAYSLDPNKLNRIINNSFVNNVFFIPPPTAGSLLGIYQSNHFNYGFDFRMVPALNISILPSPVPNIYNVSVLDYAGHPAINANVNATLFLFCEPKGQPPLSNQTTAYNVTNINGFTQLNLPTPAVSCPNSSQQGTFLVVDANYYGLEFQNYLLNSNICKSQMLLTGQYVVANFSSNGSGCNLGGNNGSVFTGGFLYEVTSSLSLIVNPLVSCPSSQPPCNLLNNGANNYSVYQLQNPVSDLVVFAGLLITTNGKDYFVLASNPTTPTGVIEYSSNSLTTLSSGSSGLTQTNAPAAVTVSRLVTVGTNTWFATLTVWVMGKS